MMPPSDDAWETVVYLGVLKHACFTYLLDMLEVGHQLTERTIELVHIRIVLGDILIPS
jgi:hypothetical protein